MRIQTRLLLTPAPVLRPSVLRESPSLSNKPPEWVLRAVSICAKFYVKYTFLSHISVPCNNPQKSDCLRSLQMKSLMWRISASKEWCICQIKYPKKSTHYDSTRSSINYILYSLLSSQEGKWKHEKCGHIQKGTVDWKRNSGLKAEQWPVTRNTSASCWWQRLVTGTLELWGLMVSLKRLS